jgi:hypothetical protein
LGIVRRLSPLLLVAAVAAGCGSSHTAARSTTAVTTTSATTAATAAPQPLSLRIYLLRDGRVAPVARTIPATLAVGRAALEQLLAGPESGETLATAIPAGTTLDGLSIDAGVASVRLSQPLPPAAGAQVVYTLTQFPSVHAVRLDGSPPRTRADFEDETPQILVESPLPGAGVTTPLRISGTANTFEATFEADVLDANGTKLASQTITAKSGSGQRGTFAASIAFDAPPGAIRLAVYEVSAADGSHLHQVEIPLRLAKR